MYQRLASNTITTTLQSLALQHFAIVSLRRMDTSRTFSGGGGCCGVPSVISVRTAGLGASGAASPLLPLLLLLLSLLPLLLPDGRYFGSPRYARASQPPAEWPIRST